MPASPVGWSTVSGTPFLTIITCPLPLILISYRLEFEGCKDVLLPARLSQEVESSLHHLTRLAGVPIISTSGEDNVQY